MMRRQQVEKIKCFLCEKKQDVDFMEIEPLSQFMTERGKIYSRIRSQICAKHQRRVAVELKRARFLALLPYVVRPE